MLSLSFSIPGTAMAAGKPDVIHVALIGDYSGPYAPTVGPTRSGAEDAWQYINEKLGGVRGVKVKPVIRDMSGKVALGLSMYNEVINMKPKPAFIDIYITPLSEALRERYVEDDVVGFHAAAVVSLYPQANSYGLYPLYPEQLAVAVKWVRDNWKEKRNPRVGIITWDTAYGRAILTDEFFAYLKKIGVDFVGTPQLFGIRDINVTTQLMNLRAERPDYLMANNAAGGALAIHKGLREMGWNIPLLNTAGEDWGTVRLDPPSFDGDIIPMHVKSFDETDDPSIKTIMKFFNQNKRTINDRTLFYLIPWYNALLQHKIMTEVVDKYGWKGLNTVNIKKALNNVKDFAPLKGLTRISYSEKQRTPSVIRLYRVTGGKFLPLTGFLKVPDMRPAEYR
jgi:ABC-type branched-subunit amino acid transport system substrate-binding protein